MIYVLIDRSAYGLIGTAIHVLSGNVKFLFMGSDTILKVVGLGELFSNYLMTMSIDDHMIWRRSIHPLSYFRVY